METVPPRESQQRLARLGHAAPLRERDEEPELGGGEGDLLALAGDHLPAGVDAEAAGLDDDLGSGRLVGAAAQRARGTGGPRPSEDRAQARVDLARRHRKCHDVVRADREIGDGVDLVVPRGEDQQRGAGRPSDLATRVGAGGAVGGDDDGVRGCERRGGGRRRQCRLRDLMSEHAEGVGASSRLVPRRRREEQDLHRKPPRSMRDSKVTIPGLPALLASATPLPQDRGRIGYHWESPECASSK
nr:hypothetical protein [Tsukamurella tyrosinosolvens]